MKLYITQRNSNVSAVGEYDPLTKAMTVLKGSIVSADVAHSDKFRSAKTIEKNRQRVVIDSVVADNITFKSSSTAANFVTGRSSNGLIVWKDKAGRTLKEILMEG